MDFTLNEEQKMLVDTIRTMGQREKFKELARQLPVDKVHDMSSGRKRRAKTAPDTGAEQD